MVRKNLNKKILIFLIGIFFVFTGYLAINLKMGISPDSSYHLEVSREYSKTLGIPENTSDTYQWRDITRIPYLYFWINGRILNVNNGVLDEVMLLRFVNIFYSVCTVVVAYLLSKEILKDRIKSILPIFFLINTLMFVFLSSSINYDNLVNLLCVLSIFLFVKFVKNRNNLRYFLMMIFVLLLGTLTKFTVLPLAFILVTLSIFDVVRNKRLNLSSNIINIPMILLVVGFGYLNFQLYGTNLIRYKSLEPECEQILTHDQCLENGVYFRDNITIPEVENNGYQDFVKMILNGERIDPIRYLGIWSFDMIGKIYGIMGDSSMYIPILMKIGYLLFYLFVVVTSVVFRRRFNTEEKYLIAISLFYLFILFFFQNYDMYLRRNNFYLALQGRYLFPVIIPIYIIVSKAIIFFEKKKIFYFILFPILLLFSFGCIPYFLLNVETWWFK